MKSTIIRITAWVFAVLAGASSMSAQLADSQTGIPVRVWAKATSGGAYSYPKGYDEIITPPYTAAPGAGYEWADWGFFPDGLKWLWHKPMPTTYVTASIALNATFQPWSVPSSSGQPDISADGYATGIGSAGSPGQAVNVDLGLVRVVPGKVYTVNAIYGNAVGSSLNVVPPPGYRVILNGMFRNACPLAPQIAVRIVPMMDMIPGLAGHASSVTRAHVGWRLAMGTLHGGQSAGHLELVDAGTGDLAPLFTPAGLSYASPSDEVFVHHQNGVVRQIIANQIAADVVTLSANSYEVRCYNPQQIQSYVPCSFSGLPFAVYRIEPGTPDAPYTSDPTAVVIKFTRETRNVTDLQAMNLPLARTETMTLQRTGTMPNFRWVKKDWTVTGQLPAAVTTVQSSSNVTTRTENITVGGASGATALQVTRNYSKLSIGEELTQESVGSTNSRTLGVSYYTDTAAPGSFGYIQAINLPGGGWEAYDYYDTNLATGYQIGQVKFKYRPFVDAPANVTKSQTQGEVTYYEYDTDPFGFRRRLKSTQTFVNGVETARSTFTYENAQSLGGGFSAVLQTRKDHAQLNTALTTKTVFYPEHYWDGFARGQKLSVENSDGTKQVFAYDRGMWNGTTFTADLAPYTASRTIVVNGATTGPTSISTFGGRNITQLYVTPGKSTAHVTIRDERALVVRAEVHVWSSNAWNLVSWVNLTYDHTGLLVNQTASNGAVYTATYDGLLKTKETDEAGTTTSYIYDAARRLSISTKAGAGAIESLSTRFTYDAVGNVVREEIGAGLGEQLVTTQQYDDAGRPIAATAPGQGTTTFTYDVPNRSQTVNRPDGATVIEKTYRDGQPASKTGTGIVAEFFHHGIESATGNRWTRAHVGAADSPRWKLGFKDWLGRDTDKVQPKFGSTATSFVGIPSPTDTNIFLQRSSYNDTAGATSTGHVVRVTESDKAATLHVYDAFGRLVRTGLDITGNIALDLVSSDRITDQDQYIEYYSNAWWARRETKVYPKTTSGTAEIMSVTRTRLSGFQPGRLEEIQATDSVGNTTTKTRDVDRTAAKVTLTTTTTGISQPEVETRFAGLSVSTKTSAGLTTTTTYDALRRPIEVTNPRGNKTRTNYVTGTTLGQSIIQPYIAPSHASNITIATYTYDSAGRRISDTNAGGFTTYSAYTLRGQLHRAWGSAAIPVEYGYHATYGEKVTMKTFRGGTGWDVNAWPGTPGNSSNSTGTADTTTWAYDAATGLLLSKTDAEGRAVTYTHNRRGQLSTRTWARGVVTTYAYDTATAEQRDILYSDSTPALHYTFNRLGQGTQIEDATGFRTLAHCLCGKVSSEQLDVSFYGSRKISYKLSDAPGTVQSRTMGYTLARFGTIEQDITYNYDPASGRATDVGTQTGFAAGTHEFHYTYLANSDIIKSLSVDSSHPFTITREFETNRDVITSIDTKWSTTSRARYDYIVNNLGQRTSITQSGNIFADYGDSTHQSLSYNGKGELTGSTGYLGSSVDGSKLLPDRKHEYAYDNIGNRQWSNVTGNSTLRDDYQVNALNQYTTKENNAVNLSGTADANAKVVVAGRTAAAARKGRFWSDQITVANVLKSWRGPLTLHVGKAGAGSGGTDLLGTHVRMAEIPKQQQGFTYDLDGNLTSDGVWDYVWDAENRLIRMTTTADAVSGGYPSRRLEFKYDYLGRRVQKLVYDHAASQLLDARRFVYQGWNLIAEYAVNSAFTILTLTRSYTWGLDIAHTFEKSGGVGALVQIADHALGKAYFPAYDGNGNVGALLDGAASGGTAGACVAAYEYSSYGEFLRCEGIYAKENLFRFSTKFTDDETGLVYYGRRYYSPSQGRFLGRDPKMESGGLNLYSFATNNPINRWDYLGMLPDGNPENEGETITVAERDASGIVYNNTYIAKQRQANNSERVMELYWDGPIMSERVGIIHPPQPYATGISIAVTPYNTAPARSNPSWMPDCGAMRGAMRGNGDAQMSLGGINGAIAQAIALTYGAANQYWARNALDAGDKHEFGTVVAQANGNQILTGTPLSSPGAVFTPSRSLANLIPGARYLPQETDNPLDWGLPSTTNMTNSSMLAFVHVHPYSTSTADPNKYNFSVPDLNSALSSNRDTILVRPDGSYEWLSASALRNLGEESRQRLFNELNAARGAGEGNMNSRQMDMLRNAGVMGGCP